MPLVKPLAITMGEPAGIGVELCLHLLADDGLPPLVVLGDRQLLARRALSLGLPFAAADYPQQAKRAVWHLPAVAPVAAGDLQPVNACYVLTLLEKAAEACQRGEFTALVTAPISKKAILAAGIPFIGQTEYLAAQTGARCPVMLLAAPTLRVALATTHLPLRKVAASLSSESLLDVLDVLNSELPCYFATHQPPKIKVCGLNPHAGEGGMLGDEEQTILMPAICQAQAQGMHVEGPFAADTLLATAQLSQVDCVVAMYHDQGLPAVKSRDFQHTINITLGLPFLRTSPDHGIALDIAAAGGANPSSMIAAVRFAAQHFAAGNI